MRGTARREIDDPDCLLHLLAACIREQPLERWGDAEQLSIGRETAFRLVEGIGDQPAQLCKRHRVADGQIVLRESDDSSRSGHTHELLEHPGPGGCLQESHEVAGIDQVEGPTRQVQRSEGVHDGEGGIVDPRGLRLSACLLHQLGMALDADELYLWESLCGLNRPLAIARGNVQDAVDARDIALFWKRLGRLLERRQIKLEQAWDLHALFWQWRGAWAQLSVG